MFSHKKKLLTLSLFIALFASEGALGGEFSRDQLMDNGNGTQTLTRLESTKEAQESKTDFVRHNPDVISEDAKAKERAQRDLAEQQKIRDILGIKGDSKPSLWKLPYYFVQSLFQPFIEDIREKGIVKCTKNVVGAVGVAVSRDPLMAAIAVGTMYSGGVRLLGGDTTSIQIMLVSAGQVREVEYLTEQLAPVMEVGLNTVPKVIDVLEEERKKIEKEGISTYALSRGRTLGKSTIEFVQSDTFFRLVKVAAYGGATYYILSLVPGADAQYTPILGPEYKINQNGLSTIHYSSTGLPNGAVATGFPSGTGDMVARIHFPNNGTFVAGEFGVSTITPTVTASQLVPCTGSFSTGNWFMAWLESTSVLKYRVMTSAGGYVTSPIQVNSAGESAVQIPSCVGLGTRGLISWANSTAGAYKDLYVTFASDGTGLSAPTILAQSSTGFGYSLDTVLGNGDALLVYGPSAGSNIVGAEVTPTGTLVTTSATINTSPSIGTFSPAGLVGGTGKDAIVVYRSGTSNLIGRSIQNLVPTGSEFTVHSGSTNIAGPSAAGLTDGTALTAWQDVQGSTLSINATLLSPSGAAQSAEFIVPSGTNPNGAGSPQVTRLLTGGAYVTYTDTLDIYGRQVTFSSSPTSSPPPTTSSLTSSPAPTSGSPAPTSTGPAPTTTSPAPTSTSSPPLTSGSPAPTSTGTQAPTSSTTSPATSAAHSLSPSGWTTAIVGGISALVAWYYGA